MKDTSRILLLTSGIFGFVQSALYLVFGIVFTSLGSRAVSELYSNGIAAIIFGIIFFFLAAHALIGSILCLLSRKKEYKSLYISALVMTVLGINPIGVVSSIFGILYQAKKDETDEIPAEEVEAHSQNQ